MNLSSSQPAIGGVPAPVLVCFAVPEEARGFKPPLVPSTQVIVTGMGPNKAKAGLTTFLSRTPARLVITCGFAGGLNPMHPLGQVLLDDSQAGTFRDPFADLPLQRGRFTHTDRVLVTRGEKQTLFEATNADAVEMESSTIQTLCVQRRLPVLILRVISDAANEDLPMDFNRYSNANGDLNMGRLLLGIAGSPGVIPRLMKFRRQLNAASRSLHTALGQILSRAAQLEE